MAKESEHYQPKDAIQEGLEGTVGGAVVGLGISCVQNTLTRKNVGAMGVFTRTGGSIFSFAALLGAYQFVTSASANLRERNDSLNPFLGGFAGGTLAHIRSRSTARVLGAGALIAATMALFDFCGGDLRGPPRDPNVDEFARKEQLRLHRRGPIEEALAWHGEGRGIEGPGYRERRAQRIKEKYGIDVPST